MPFACEGWLTNTKMFKIQHHWVKNMLLFDAVLLVCVLMVLNIEDNGVVGAVKKCYWIFALAVLTGGMLVSVAALTKVYLSNPVSVGVSVRRDKQLVFPAVTVCNMSPVKKSALETADLSGAAKRRKKRTTSGGPCTLSHCKHLNSKHTFQFRLGWLVRKHCRITATYLLYYFMQFDKSDANHRTTVT